MVDEDDKKDEQKFEFDAAGEVIGYISLDQARVLAMRTAREAPGEYGSRYSRVPMAFEVMGEEETEDHYVITLTFRPQGEFLGTPGQEQFFIEKEGSVAHRQVMSIPRSPGGRRTRTVLVVIGLVTLAAGAAGGVVLASGGGGGEDGSTAPVVQLNPTNTPVPAMAEASATPARANTPVPLSTATATATQELPTPTAVPMRAPTFTPTGTPTSSPTLPSLAPLAELGTPTRAPIATATPTPVSVPTATVPADPNLLLYLPFDLNIADYSGSSLSTLARGGPIELVPGIYGQAARFDGSGASVDVPGVSDLPILDELTLEFWVNMADWSNPYTESADIESVASLGVFYTVSVRSDNWGLQAILTTENGGQSRTVLEGGHVLPGQWRHIALVYSNSNDEAVLYLDGNPVDNRPVSGSVPPNTNSFRVGTWFEQNQAFAGLVDELRLYNVALAPALIQEHARLPGASSGPTPTPVEGNLALNPSLEDGEGSPAGWASFRRQTDAEFVWDTRIAHSGTRSLGITASQMFAQAGFPGWETVERIPIDPDKTYDLSVWYYVTDLGLPPFVDIEVFDSSGNAMGSTSTGAFTLPPLPNQWLRKAFTFNPGTLAGTFPDIAEVKLRLGLLLDYDAAGVPEGTVSTINFDDVTFRVR